MKHHIDFLVLILTLSRLYCLRISYQNGNGGCVKIYCSILETPLKGCDVASGDTKWFTLKEQIDKCFNF